jgi:glycosyltransferase involved in cell wall biosynthesis
VGATTSQETLTPEGECGGLQIIHYGGLWYAVPPELVRIDPRRPGRTLNHPAVLWAPSREALLVRIEGYDPAPYRAERVGEFEGHDLLRHGGRVYGVPRELGPVDLNVEEDRNRDGIVRGDSPEQVAERIRAARAAKPVEFLGWLPVFKRFGNCGAHPQFGHTEAPPPGYRFARSQMVSLDDDAPPKRPSLFRRAAALAGALGLSLWMLVDTARKRGPRRTLATFCRFVGFVAGLVRATGRVMPALRFAHSRNFQSQAMAPRSAELAFLTSVPYTYGQSPWVIEVEDATTLFFPYLHNGRTAGLDVRSSPYFPVVKAMLEADHCRGIVTHMRSTAEMLPVLFQSEKIARKVTYSPLGVRLPARYQEHDDEGGPVNLLFTNSWHQNPQGFFLRGGLDVLEAFDVLRRRYPQVRLTIRAVLPWLEERHIRIIESGWVRVMPWFVPAGRMDELQRESHIYLLPAARIHIVSVLQAMSYGQAVVVSDGWGMDEYVEHGRNGLVVPGRHGKVSWADPEAGMLRENYGPMYAPDRRVVEGLVESVSLLIEQRGLRKRLGNAARRDVETKYTLDQWNAALKAAFDKARAA